VGAGTAGLTAANDLRMAGLSVVVLEARDRVGGEFEDERLVLAERLSEDVLFGRPVLALRWSPTPSVTAVAGDLTVRARFAIVAHGAQIDVEPAVPQHPNTAPIHVAPSDDLARTVASTI